MPFRHRCQTSTLPRKPAFNHLLPFFLSQQLGHMGQSLLSLKPLFFPKHPRHLTYGIPNRVHVSPQRYFSVEFLPFTPQSMQNLFSCFPSFRSRPKAFVRNVSAKFPERRRRRHTAQAYASFERAKSDFSASRREILVRGGIRVIKWRLADRKNWLAGTVRYEIMASWISVGRERSWGSLEITRAFISGNTCTRGAGISTTLYDASNVTLASSAILPRDLLRDITFAEDWLDLSPCSTGSNESLEGELSKSRVLGCIEDVANVAAIGNVLWSLQ